jgi:hypothetical protein
MIITGEINCNINAKEVQEIFQVYRPFSYP